MSNKKFSYYLYIVCFFMSSHCFAEDRLSQAAIEQKAPEKSLLLTITRVDERLIAAGEHGVIVYSDDQAVTWQQSMVPSSTLITDLGFISEKIGWAIGHDGIVLKTENGGLSWNKVLDGAQINQLRVSALSEEVKSQQQRDEGGTDFLDDLNYQLEDAVIALKERPSAPLLDLFFVDARHGYALGAYGLFLETTDGGEHWHYQGHRLPNDEGLHLNRMFKTKAGSLFILGEAGLLIESMDQGESWEIRELPYQGSLFSAVEVDHILYVMGLRGTVLKRVLDRSGGGAWEQVNIESTATINDAIVVNQIAYLVGQDGAMLKKDSAGFAPFSRRGLSSYSAVDSIGNYLVIVGEGGVSRVLLSGGVNE